jgi:FixJ family two-component response regulator
MHMNSDLAYISILDGDATTRDQIAQLVDATGWHAQRFSSAREFLSAPRMSKPGCLILDVNLPDLNGLELQMQLAHRSELPLIFCTDSQDVLTSVQAMKAGASEFLTKPICAEHMLHAIKQAIQTSRLALAKELKLRHLQARYEALSRREREVMALVVAGRLNKIVGSELGISEITVKAHRGKVMRKMNARSLVDLVTMAALIAPLVEEQAWPPHLTTGRLATPGTILLRQPAFISRIDDGGRCAAL